MFSAKRIGRSILILKKMYRISNSINNSNKLFKIRRKKKLRINDCEYKN